MPKTNAERQRAYILRLKSRAAPSEHTFASDVMEFRKECEFWRSTLAQTWSRPDFDLGALLHHVLENPETCRDLYGPVLAKALGLPADPWPGLTGNALEAMTRGRSEDAGQRGLHWSEGSGEVDFFTKLTAAQNRRWLEEGQVKEAA